MQNIHPSLYAAVSNMQAPLIAVGNASLSTMKWCSHLGQMLGDGTTPQQQVAIDTNGLTYSDELNLLLRELEQRSAYNRGNAQMISFLVRPEEWKQYGLEEQVSILQRAIDVLEPRDIAILLEMRRVRCKQHLTCLRQSFPKSSTYASI